MVHSGFKWLTGDVNWDDYGGMWYKRTGKRTFEVVEFMPWAEYDSSAIEQYGKYNVVAGEVDLSRADDLKSALRSCGWELKRGSLINSYDGETVCARKYVHAVCAEAMFRHGAHSHHTDASGNNKHALLRSVGVFRPNAHLKLGHRG